MSKNIVFLHGFLGDPKEFEAIVSPINKAGLNCYSLDLNLAKSFSLKAMADYVHEKLVKLNIKESHFWGYSMGGRVLLELFRNYPEMCESLTLESTSPGIIDPQERNNRVKMDADWANLIQTQPDTFLEKWYSQVLFSGFKKLNNYSSHLQSKEKALSPTHAKMIMEASPGANPHYFKVIEAMSVPTLALVGQKDEKYVQMWGKLIDHTPQIAIPNNNIDLKVVENSGHVIHLENPTGAVEKFLSFIKEHS
jgi:2-succinyl-6-hydroxy-2,4-cyclohexadiene-1-carboxylate synthase